MKRAAQAEGEKKQKVESVSEAKETIDTKKELEAMEKKLNRMKKCDTWTTIMFFLIIIAMVVAKFLWNAQEMERKRKGI